MNRRSFAPTTYYSMLCQIAAKHGGRLLPRHLAIHYRPCRLDCSALIVSNGRYVCERGWGIPVKEAFP